MQRKLELGNRKAVVSDKQISLDGFVFSPAETHKITGLLGFAGSMSGLQAFPPSISDTPFMIEFQEDGVHKLLRQGAGGAFTFKFNSLSDTIDAFQKALDVSLDLKKLVPRANPNADLTAGTPDIIEGRS